MTTKIYKPMKLLMRKHNCALRFVHHMGKGGADDTRRGGQKMLGGTANHAWSEDSLYVMRDPKKAGTIRVEFESKSAPERTYTVSGLDNRAWTPYFEPERPREEAVPTRKGRAARGERTPKDDTANPLLDLLKQGGMWPTQAVADAVQSTYHPTYRRLRDLETKGLIKRDGKHWKPI
jgi:hypothetical protein